MNFRISNKLIIVALVIFSILSITHAAISEVELQRNPQNTKPLVQTLGYLGLSIPSECLSSRNPLLEPICLPDIPGGYCYHESCAKVGPVYLGKSYTVEVIHP